MIAHAASTVTQPSDFPAGRSAGGSVARIRAGRALSGFVALFLLMDGLMKLLGMPVAVDATVQLGYPHAAVTTIGLVLVACTLMYLIPRTAGAGAVLLTGYLGGAVATHVRAGGSWFNILFPVICGVMVWGGLRLRNGNFGRLLPLASDGGQAIRRAQVWTGRVLSGLFILFMLGASAFPKFFMPEIAHATMTPLGWPVKFTLLIGTIEVVGTLLYAIPRTSVLGAVLLMGLFGGAMATHLRVESPLFSHTLFSIYLGLMMWGGLWLRDPKLRAVFPFRS